MNAMITSSKQTHRIAAVLAVVATLFAVGGTLSLAEHYAQAGVAGAEHLAGSTVTRVTQPG